MWRNLRRFLLDQLLHYEAIDLIDRLSPEDEANLGMLYQDDFYKSLKRLFAIGERNIQVENMASQSKEELYHHKGRFRTYLAIEKTMEKLHKRYLKKNKE